MDNGYLLNALARHIDASMSRIALPRYGIVSNVNPNDATVRVTLQPEGVTTGWMPDGTHLATAGGFGLIAPPQVGDQVGIDFPHGDADHPRVCGRYYSSEDMPPTSPATGKPVQPGEIGFFYGGAYIHLSGGTVYIFGGPKVVVSGAEEVDITAPVIKLNGAVQVQGSITATGDVTANGISLENHLHQSTQPGTGESGPPAPGT